MAGRNLVLSKLSENIKSPASACGRDNIGESYHLASIDYPSNCEGTSEEVAAIQQKRNAFKEQLLGQFSEHLLEKPIRIGLRKSLLSAVIDVMMQSARHGDDEITKSVLEYGKVNEEIQRQILSQSDCDTGLLNLRAYRTPRR